MPITKSAIKRARQNAVRQDRLQPYKTRMKTVLRKVEEAAKAGKKADIAAMLPQAYKAIDLAAKKGIIHKRNADNKKSKLARMASTK